VHFGMSMTGRVVFKTKVFDTTEDESQFVSLPRGIGYKQAIQMMQTEGAGTSSGPGIAANQ